MGFWRDPDFDPSERAFYCVRVLEIPTPTWLAYDKAYFGERIELPEDAVMVHQERAYTPPIWYTPQQEGPPAGSERRPERRRDRHHPFPLPV